MFMIVKGMNEMKKKEEEAPAEPPEPSTEEKLLTDIRDLLAKKGWANQKPWVEYV